MSSEQVFKGYAVESAEKWDEFKIMEFTPKTFEEEDIELQITHCGVCGMLVKFSWLGLKLIDIK